MVRKKGGKCVFVHPVCKILKFDNFINDEVFLTFQPQFYIYIVNFFLFFTVTKAQDKSLSTE